jgi:hypothetical protein
LHSATSRHARTTTYVAIWLLALAFGVIEGAVAVYLREIYVRDASLGVSSRIPDLAITLVSLPERLVSLEIVREACTMILLAATAWLSGRRLADRIGVFLLAFGIWDLVYYVVLRVFLGWPSRVNTWDVLFLIPVPWVAPMWTPALIAVLFVVAGSYLFWTGERPRRYGWGDAAALLGGALLTTASFLVESDSAVVHRIPDRFPLWLYWSGVLLAAAGFVRAERAGPDATPGTQNAKRRT